MSDPSVQLYPIDNLSQYDPVQVNLLSEPCILVDANDHVIGQASKKDSHLRSNIDKNMLHRAFSLFLFNEEGKLLLQQRSSNKITFPSCWTNSCCSHPLSIPEELVEEGQLGVRSAVRRRLSHELGINPADISLDDFHFLTRIHYSAPFDSTWGEHEIDYILFLKKNVKLQINLDEVSKVSYVSPQELEDLIEKSKVDSLINFSPWFSLISQNHLSKWWDSLLHGKLDQVSDDKIHRFC